MKTDLSTPFQAILSSRVPYEFPFHQADEPALAYEQLLNRLRASTASKIRCTLNTASELAPTAALGLAIADTIILTGAGATRPGDKLKLHPWRNTVQVELPASAAGRPINASLARFDDFPLARFYRDAKRFIEDGRVLYLPSRMVSYQDGVRPDGTRHWQAHSVDFDSPSNVWRMAAEARQAAATALHIRPSSLVPESNAIEVVRFALPYLTDIPLATLHRVLEDYDGPYLRFRGALTSAIRTALRDISDADDLTALRAVGVSLRTEVIEPEVSKVADDLKRIVQVRAIRTTGVVVGTVCLALVAVPIADLPVQPADLAGAGGLGALFKGWGDLRSELLELQKHPWYLALQLTEAVR